MSSYYNQRTLNLGRDKGEKTFNLGELELDRQPGKILLLEDEPDFASLVKEFLEASGFDVTWVENGAEGIKNILTEDYDTILCDMLMPNVSGDMFYLAVQRSRPHMCKRFVFVTGQKGDKKIDEFIRSVNGCVLWKPIDFQDLISAVKVIIKKHGTVH